MKLLEVEGWGHVPQCPIAGDATAVEMSRGKRPEEQCPRPSIGATWTSSQWVWTVMDNSRTNERMQAISRPGPLAAICPELNYAQLSAVRRPLPRQRWWQRQGWRRMTSWASVSQEMRKWDFWLINWRRTGTGIKTAPEIGVKRPWWLKLKFHWDQFPRNFLADLLATSPTSS